MVEVFVELTERNDQKVSGNVGTHLTLNWTKTADNATSDIV